MGFKLSTKLINKLINKPFLTASKQQSGRATAGAGKAGAPPPPRQP
jgi:hypothetical protein